MNLQNLERINSALTSKYWAWVYLGENCPKTLLEVLSKELPLIDSNSWLDRLSLGGGYVNGQRVISDVPLSPPCKVEYFEPKFDLEQIDEYLPKFSQDLIIYEDSDLIAVFKPIRLPSLPTRDQLSHNLKHHLEEYVGGKVHMPSRLDTSTEGLIIASKSPSMHNRLQRVFERRDIKKQYILEVTGTPAWCDLEVTDPIGRDPLHPVLRRVLPPGTSEGKDAKTSFRVISPAPKVDPSNSRTILEAIPETGRTHQIRVHASSIGFPIVGDNFYGGEIAPSLHLLSFSATFPHPSNGKLLELRVPSRLYPNWLNSKCMG